MAYSTFRERRVTNYLKTSVRTFFQDIRAFDVISTVKDMDRIARGTLSLIEIKWSGISGRCSL